MTQQRIGLVGRIVHAFITRNLSVLLIAASVAAGIVALMVTPREEEPQIVVPMADVFIQMPGHGAAEVEQFVSTRLEKLLYQIDGVEYVYSMSRPNYAVVTVRFYVGQDREQSLVRLYNKIQMNVDLVPPGVTGWVVKPVEIDDVPVVAVTLYSGEYSSYELRRLAEELENKLQAVPKTGRTRIIGGLRRAVTVHMDPIRMAAHELTPLDLDNALKASNLLVPAGSFQKNDREVSVDAGGLLVRANEVADLVVGVQGDRPVYLNDVATVTDGPEELSTYTSIGFGPAAEKDIPERYRTSGSDYPAVTLAIAKQKGTNAVIVSRAVQDRLEELKKTVLPDGVQVVVSRDYGATANDKVNNLVESLGMAIIVVIGLLLFTLGWRESLIVALAVPITFSLTLLVNHMAGYTINRVTLFALILSLGLVVDDPIINVDNIQRHIRMRPKEPLDATMTAVQEVLPPVILSSLAIIVSFVPMFFITGMMGPYMQPMSVNVPLAIVFSTICALTIVPWLSYLLLKNKGGQAETPGEATSSFLFRMYRWVVNPFLGSAFLRWGLFVVVFFLFIGAACLALFGYVPLKMLPYDNKNEFQIVVDMDEGTTLERTAAATYALADYLRTVPEVTNYSVFVGTSSPMDFNGLVRHYYLREAANVADIRVNLVHRDYRDQQSHAIALRLRNDLKDIARKWNANVKIVEVPPGPPVLATVTGEVYGSPYNSYGEIIAAAEKVEALMKREEGLVDVDDTIEAPQERAVFRVDKEKAALNGISTEELSRIMKMSLSGESSSVLHLPHEDNPLPILLRLPRSLRSGLEDLKGVYVKGKEGLVDVSELGRFEKSRVDQTIYHKNLRPVVYLYGEMAGKTPADAVLHLQKELDQTPLPQGFRVEWAGEGEWKITVDVFRDLGIAFAVACLGIYILLVYETRTYLIPLLLMIAIPLTVIGIMPGFLLLNSIGVKTVGGYANPVFFTATAMIGMIALSGIVVRNSVVLITFIRDSVNEGMSLQEAILTSGAVRMRPIFLTAGTTALSAWPITLDPVFSGLAWALIFGLVVSTLFTLVLVPVAYYMVNRKKTAIL